jgi:hypothetical protein
LRNLSRLTGDPHKSRERGSGNELELFLLAFPVTCRLPAKSNSRKEPIRSRRQKKWNDDAHIQGSAGYRCYELQLIVTFVQQETNARKLSIVSASTSRGGLARESSLEGSQNPICRRRLPKTWAMADAFSLLTLATELAQY